MPFISFHCCTTTWQTFCLSLSFSFFLFFSLTFIQSARVEHRTFRENRFSLWKFLLWSWFCIMLQILYDVLILKNFNAHIRLLKRVCVCGNIIRTQLQRIAAVSYHMVEWNFSQFCLPWPSEDDEERKKTSSSFFEHIKWILITFWNRGTTEKKNLIEVFILLWDAWKMMSDIWTSFKTFH